MDKLKKYYQWFLIVLVVIQPFIELDYLIYYDPVAYVELIVEGDPKQYLQAVTRYELPEKMM